MLHVFLNVLKIEIVGKSHSDASQAHQYESLDEVAPDMHGHEWNSCILLNLFCCRYLSCSILGCLLGGVYVPCIYRMPGGVIVGDSGLCCCGPAFNVWRSSAITSHFLLILCFLYIIILHCKPFMHFNWTGLFLFLVCEVEDNLLCLQYFIQNAFSQICKNQSVTVTVYVHQNLHHTFFMHNKLY